MLACYARRCAVLLSFYHFVTAFYRPPNILKCSPKTPPPWPSTTDAHSPQYHIKSFAAHYIVSNIVKCVCFWVRVFAVCLVYGMSI